MAEALQRQAQQILVVVVVALTMPLVLLEDQVLLFLN
jgi:hypothetical protein